MASGKRPETPHSSDQQPRSEPFGEPPPSASATAPDAFDTPAMRTEPDNAQQRSPEPSSSGPLRFEAPPSDSATPTITMNQPPPRSFFPALLAASSLGAAAALLAAAILWFGGFLPSREDNVSSVAARVAALELHARDLAGQSTAANATEKSVEDLAARLARVEGAAPTPDPQVTNRLGAAEAIAKSATDGVATLNRRIEELAAVLAEARSRADTVAASVQAAAAAPAGVDANKAEIEALKARLAALESTRSQQVDKKDLDALATRIAAFEQAVASLDQAAKAAQAAQAASSARGRAVRLAILAAALNAAVDRGAPYAPELNAVKPLAPPNALAPLEPFAASGLPSADALARELSDLLPRLQQTGSTGETGSILDKLQANASRLVRIRPVTEQPGDDPRAVLARIEVKAAQSDIGGALAEAGKLPPEQRAAAEPWMRKAQARMAAVEACRRLAAESLAAVANLPQ